MLALTTALVPILIVGFVWLVLRVRFVRRAGAAQRFIDAAPDLDLFALRAMANQPMPRLARVSDDPAGAWRRGDLEVIHALALLELQESGLRPPPPATRVTIAGRRSASGHRQVPASASTCSPERMSLTWSPSSSPAPGNQTNGMPRRSA